jgi:glucokinase
MSGAETIGVDLGGTKLLLGVLDENRKLLFESRESSRGQAEDELVELLAQEIAEAHEARPGIAAVGLGIPATIDHNRGYAFAAVNLPFDEVPIRDLVQERTELPVFVDNDANVAMLAEHLYGAARGTRNALLLTVGTGIGGGLIINGEPYRGTVGAGAELGHVVIQLDGPPCQGYCPGRGHLETLASGTALGKEGHAAAERNPDSALGRMLAAGQEVDGKAVTEAAIAGDEVARGAVAEIGRRLGAGLSGFANIFEPEVMVVGGGVSAAGDLLLDPARKVVAEQALSPMNRTPIVAAQLGPDAGMIGAAAMARTELERGGPH